MTYRCRKCHTVIDGMGSPCPGCSQPQRVMVAFANGTVRALPRGMDIQGFDRLLLEAGV